MRRLRLGETRTRTLSSMRMMIARTKSQMKVNKRVNISCVEHFYLKYKF